MKARALALIALLPGAASAWPVYGDSADAFNQTRESTPRADGFYHVDTPFLIQRLQQLHVNVYAFLLWRSPTDWDDLTRDFVPAAEQANLETWVYLVPPSEANGFNIPPCNQDYVCWANQIGALAQAHPIVTSYLMDDFNANRATFTPTYVSQMAAAARAHAGVRFYAVDYWPSVTTDLANGYAGSVDGIVFPYIDLDSETALPMQLDAVCAAARSQLSGRCLLMVYAGWTSWHKANPTPQYVTAALTDGQSAIQAGTADGIITYRLDKSLDSAMFPVVASLYDKWNPPPPDAAATDSAIASDSAIAPDLSHSASTPQCSCALGRRRAPSPLLLLFLGALHWLGRRRRGRSFQSGRVRA